MLPVGFFALYVYIYVSIDVDNACVCACVEEEEEQEELSGACVRACAYMLRVRVSAGVCMM